MCDRNHLAEKALDSQARRIAKRAGLRAVKSRGSQHLNNLGYYMLVNDRNFVVGGPRFDLTAEEVIELCADRGTQ